MEFLRLSWQNIENMCDKITEEIRKRNYQIDVIVAVSRGGLIPARILSDRLEVRLITSISIVFYDDIGKRLNYPRLVQGISNEQLIKDKNILLCDDIVDTGESLELAINHLKELKPKNIISASLLVKPHTKRYPDIFEQETGAWVIFPWETKETIKEIGDPTVLKKLGYTEEEINKYK
ncbi:MAG: phosphoribosyltransferase [Candidatus Odinarchaeota archaeon]|nr:phosphoribosyltransferase [Candidatus Odinarchaeota archaeon]